MSASQSDPWSPPSWLIDALTELDRRSGAMIESEVCDSIRRAQGRLGIVEGDPHEAVLAEQAAFAVRHKRDRNDGVWPTHFQPLMVIPVDGAQVRVSPDIQRGSLQRLAYWGRRSAEAQHPVMRARYADLCWDMAKFLGQERRPIAQAKTAIDGYLAAVAIAEPGMQMHVDERRCRALELSLGIRDKVRQQAAVRAYFESAKRVRQPGMVGTWCFLYDDLLAPDRGPELSTEQINTIVGLLEEELREAANPARRGSEYAAEAAATRLAEHYRRTSADPDRVRVLRASADAYRRRASSSDALPAVTYLERAREMYQRAGLRTEVERILVELRAAVDKARGDMHAIEAVVKIDRQKFEQDLEAMTAGGWIPAMTRFAVCFVTRRERIRQEVAKLEKEFVFQALLPKTILTHGHIVAHIGSLENDPAGRLLHGIAEKVQYLHVFRAAVLDRLRKRYEPSADSFIDYLRASPLFPEERMELIKTGIEAYLVDDHVKAIHVLVPQIEHALVTLLGLLGRPMIKPHRDSARGVLQVKSLNDAIDDEAVQQALGPDLHAHLDATLAHPKGLNIRNIVCHGLCGPEVLQRPWADIVLHDMLAVGLVREQSPEAHGEVPAGLDAGPRAPGSGETKAEHGA